MLFKALKSEMLKNQVKATLVAGIKNHYQKNNKSLTDQKMAKALKKLYDRPDVIDEVEKSCRHKCEFSYLIIDELVKQSKFLSSLCDRIR